MFMHIKLHKYTWQLYLVPDFRFHRYRMKWSRRFRKFVIHHLTDIKGFYKTFYITRHVWFPIKIQFQYLKWQEDAIPSSTSAVLEIANLVQKVQISTGNRLIVVMCKWVRQRKALLIVISSYYQIINNQRCICNWS